MVKIQEADKVTGFLDDGQHRIGFVLKT